MPAIEGLQRVGLPGQDGVGHGVGDLADRAGAQFHPEGGVQPMADLADLQFRRRTG